MVEVSQRRCASAHKECRSVRHFSRAMNPAHPRFIERRYDLSRTGITNAELADTLRPLLTRSLSRDVRFRVRELARLRKGEGGGPLTAAAAAYPDPDAGAAEIPTAAFGEIDAALARVFSPLPPVPEIDKKPADYLNCAEKCHLRLLLWNLRHGKANIDRIRKAKETTTRPAARALSF